MCVMDPITYAMEAEEPLEPYEPPAVEEVREAA